MTIGPFFLCIRCADTRAAELRAMGRSVTLGWIGRPEQGGD